MRKKITALFFIIILLFTTHTAYAEEVFVENEAELIENLTSNKTLILIDDISIQNVIQIIDKQNITIDLNVFNIENDNDGSLFYIKNCQNIKFISSADDEIGTFSISLTNGESFEIDSPYTAVNIENSTVSIEDIKVDFTSANKGANAQLFNLSKKSELQLIDCDITTNNIGKVIEADNSKVYLGKNNQELSTTNLPDKLTKVSVENLVVPSVTASGIQTHTGAISLDNDSLIEVFADIHLKSYVMQTDDIGRKGSVVAILSNKSAVNINGGTVENRCGFNANNSFSLYAIEAYKPSETNGLVISYKANEFDEDRKYGTEIISNQDTIFVSPVEMGIENYENQSDDYKITLDYASIVSGDGCKAITSISKYSDSVYSNIVIDSKSSLIYGNVIYRQGLSDSATEDRDNRYSYFAFCNDDDDNDDSNDKYIVLTRDLEIGEYRTLNFEDVNVVVAKKAKLNVLGVIENNKASGVNNSKLQINGEYELKGKCNFDIYVYGTATIYELTNANMYPKDNGDIYLDASLVKFILRNKLTYNKERQTPVFDAYFGNRLVKELSPGNTIEFEQDKQFKVSGSSSSIFVFAGNGKIVNIIRINNSSTNSHFYMTGDTTATFDIEKADFATLNPGKNLRAELNIKAIKYGYKESVSLIDFLYDDDRREYQWYREVNGEQIEIQGECEYDYIIRAEDIGNKIYCVVSFGNYLDVITSDKVTVGKGTAHEVTFPDVSEISYPQSISEATLTGGNTNGTFAWENPDEILVPGTHTRNLIFTPNDSNLYDYSNVTLTKAVSITVNKGVPSPITFPEDANVDYPSSVRNAIFTGVSTNGTFAWENPDEQLPPGTYTRKIIFTPDDSDLYDYTGVELIKEVQLTVNKADPQSIKIISKNISGLTGSRKITLIYQVYNKSGVDTPTGKIKLMNRVTNNGTQTDEVITELDLVYGKTEQYTWNIVNDNNFTIIAQYSGDDYYNPLELSTTLDTRRNTPVITISDIGQKSYGDEDFSINGSSVLPDSTDELPITYLSSDTSILSIDGNVATINKAGNVTITVKTDETEEYLGASKQVELIIAKATPNTTADAQISGSYGNRMVAFTVTVPKTGIGVTPTGTVKIVNKTGSNEIVIADNLPLTAGVAIYNWNVGIDEQFDVDIIYNGDDNYKSVTISKNIDTRKQIQSITVDSLIQKTYGNEDFEIIATATSGEAVTLISSDTSILSINGKIATIHKAGTVTCSAIVSENEIYNEVVQQFTVEISKKTIIFKADDKTIIQGTALPQFTYQDISSVLVGNDTITIQPTITCSVSNVNMPGNYTIEISGAEISNNDNYNILYENGILTIYATPIEPDDDDEDNKEDIDDKTKEVIENNDGSITTIITEKDGTIVETTVQTDGTKIETTTTNDGESQSIVTIPENKDKAVVTVPSNKKLSEGSVAVIVNEDGSREVIKLAHITDDGIKVMLNKNATIIIVENSKEFNDVEQNSWYEEAVNFVSSRELFNGTGSNNFSPSDNMTRGMFATVLLRLADGKANSLNAFEDVDSAKWYADGIAWASENNIVNGYGKQFNPNNEITREQLVTMLYRFAEYMKIDYSANYKNNYLDNYNDSDKIATYAKDAMEWAVMSGIIEGKGSNELQPSAYATRAEVSIMLQRFVKYVLN